jgi:hypothetical protein
MLSIITTLREVLELWWRNIRWITIVSLAVGIPQIFITEWFVKLMPSPKNMGHSNLAWSLSLSIGSCVAFMIAMIISDAFSSAGILGVLKAQSSGLSPWSSIKDCVRKYIWTLLRVVTILTLIGGIFVVVSQFIFINFIYLFSPKGFSFVAALSGVLFLIFLKYALADPLVVLEERGAWDALARSWRMTQGHFWYVLGCYLFLWLGFWLVDWPFHKLDHRIHAISFPIQLFGAWLESLWIVLAWVMYFRIKAADQPLDEPATEQAEGLSAL